MKLLTKTGTIYNKILGSLFVLSCVILVLIMLSVSLNVVMRYFIGRPQGWVIETVSYSLLFITFLAAAWVLHKEEHIKMDLVLNRLSPRGQSVLNTVTSILASIMWLALTWYSSQITWTLFQGGDRIHTILEPLKAPLVAVIPIGSFLLFIQSLRRTHGFLRGWRASSEETRVTDRP